jgi:predicted helicase
MRKSLLETFDKIYILNLHGNARKKETTPNGEKDENVFDIMQGVSINIFIKTTNSKKLAEVYYQDLWGKRVEKYNYLKNNSLNSVKWEKLTPHTPNYFFIPKDETLQKEYNQGFGVNELFVENVTGIVTMGDNFLIADTKEILKNRILDFLENNYSENELKEKYQLGKNYAKWITENKSKIMFDENKIVKISYRPFDEKYTYFDNLLMWRWREKIMKHFINKDNLGLVTLRQIKSGNEFHHIFISNFMIESSYISNKTGEINSFFPLYLYNYNELEQKEEKNINFNFDIIKKIENSLSLTFLKDFNELDVFDYIYAVLHNPTYREKYKEFLKTDFPKIPYPKKESFFEYIKLGKELRKLHLLDFDENRVIEFNGDSLEIEKITKKEIKIENNSVIVQINKTSTLTIPKVAWEFYIGGYQPAQKYLKDRNYLDRKSLKHYNKFIDALIKTDEVMNKIKEIK